jgi:hypothetical protein
MTMIVRPLSLSAAFFALSAANSNARADAPPPLAPVLARVEIAQGKTVTDQAVYLGPDGEVAVEAPGASSTKIHLHLQRRDNRTQLAFDLAHTGADRTSWFARGEIVQPEAGKRVLVARVAEPSGPVEIYLSVTP